MNKTFLLVFALAFVAFLTPAAIAEDVQSGKLRIGVMEFENITQDTAFNWVGRGIQESLSSKLAALPSVTVIERGQMSKLLEEQRFQMSGFTDTNTVVEAGKIMNISKAVVGSYQILSGKIHIDARVVDVKTAEDEKSVQSDGAVDQIFDQYNTLAVDLGNQIAGNTSPTTQGTTTPPPVTDNMTQAQTVELNRQDTTSFSAYEYFTKANSVLFGSDSLFTYLLNFMDDPTAVTISADSETEGLSLLEQAVKTDPEYGRAWALLGMMYYSRTYTATEAEKSMWVQLANQSTDNAVRIAQDDPYVQSLLGFFNFLLWADYSQNPDYADAAPQYSDAAYQWLDLVTTQSPDTFYSGMAYLVVIFLNMNADANFITENSSSFEAITYQATQLLPSSGVAQALHGLFLAVDAMMRFQNGVNAGTLTDQDLQYITDDFNYSIGELEHYVSAYPNGMIVGEVNDLLPTLYQFRSSLTGEGGEG